MKNSLPSFYFLLSTLLSVLHFLNPQSPIPSMASSSSPSELPTTTHPVDTHEYEYSDEDSPPHPSGFEHFKDLTRFQSLTSILSDIQQSSATDTIAASDSFRAPMILKNDIKHLVKNLSYIHKNRDALNTSSNWHRADQLLLHLMDTTDSNKPLHDFQKHPKNLHYLLQIVGKLKHWVPPHRPQQNQQQQQEEEQKQQSEGSGSSSKKKKERESPILINKDHDRAADEIVKTLVGLDCADWGMDGLMRSYEELGFREKLCLLCFSAFWCEVDSVKRVSVEMDLVIKKRVLVYWWVGEGFIENTDFDFPPIEEIGDGILKELKSKGFVESVMKSGRESNSYKMHPIVHSFVTALAKRAGFFDFSREDGRLTAEFHRSQRACLVKSRGNSLSSCRSWKGCVENRDELKKFEGIQTLFNVDEGIVDIQPEWFSKMKYLSVLHLGSWRSDSLEHIEVHDDRFLEEVKVMKQLKVFSLQGVSVINKLPDSVCKLDSLMILDLRECHTLKELPSRIGSLKSLTHLDITNCHLLTKLPKGIRLLVKLRVLNGFVIYNQDEAQEVQEERFVSRWGKKAKKFVVHDVFRSENKEVCTLRDLLELVHLRKLSVVVNSENFPNTEEVKVFKQMRGLRCLKISWEKSLKDKKTETENAQRGVGTEQMIMDPGSNAETGKTDRKVGEETRLGELTEQMIVYPGSNAETENAQRGVGEETRLGELTEQMIMDPGSNAETGKTDRKVGEETRLGELIEQMIVDPGSNAETGNTDRKVGEETRLGELTEQMIVDPGSNAETGNTDRGVGEETRHLDQLTKLELWCFWSKDGQAPEWLVPDELKSLKKLYIKGGNLKQLGSEGMKWSVETLRLKFLCNLEMEWRKLIEMFPSMTYLEKFECTKLGLFPCDHKGIWKKKKAC